MSHIPNSSPEKISVLLESSKYEAMLSFLSSIKGLLRYRRKARIDNVVFTLHKITAGILLFLSLLVSSGVYIAKPISCVSDKAVSHAIDAYCWIHSTYTVPNKTNANFSEVIVAHPGVGPVEPQDNLRVHKYYQWVCFVLFFQAMAFYMGRLIWKQKEGNRIKTLASMGFNDLTRDDESIAKRRKQCVNYFVRSLGENDTWALHYVICEIINFVNVVIQIDLTDRFVGRALSNYGLSLVQYMEQNPMLRTDPMALAFPTVTKCTFHMFGPGGNIINYDSLCVLPLNIYNEKFYPLIWVWFIILAVISGLALVYRVIVFLLPEIRQELLKRKFNVAKDELRSLRRMNMKLDYGDWFLLYQIGKNMRPSAFCDFLDELIKTISDEPIFRPLSKEKYL